MKINIYVFNPMIGCEPLNNDASSIEMRDINGNCTLYLVAKCSSINNGFPPTVPAYFTSNESYVPPGSRPAIEKGMWPADDLKNAFDSLFGVGCTLCGYRYYICDIIITDNPNVNDQLYVSHSDEAYPGYPFSEGCKDYTIIYDPNEEPIGFIRHAQEFHYGIKRGQSHYCGPGANSYYSQDRFIQIGGMHTVTAMVSNKKAYRPVQSAADLIIIASHGVYMKHDPDGLDWPAGFATTFSRNQTGCLCPPIISGTPGNHFFDIDNFGLSSPEAYYLFDNNWVFGELDNDFEDDAWGRDNSDFDGKFWQEQPGGADRVTWVVHLGYGILDARDNFGFSPILMWKDQIGKADAICGYSYLGVTTGFADRIGTYFTDYIKSDFTENPGLYICDPPQGYFYRPIRAWMEANCKVLNEYDFDDYDKEEVDNKKAMYYSHAIDMENNI
jgi:hypothetical protein